MKKTKLPLGVDHPNCCRHHRSPSCLFEAYSLLACPRMHRRRRRQPPQHHQAAQCVAPNCSLTFQPGVRGLYQRGSYRLACQQRARQRQNVQHPNCRFPPPPLSQQHPHQHPPSPPLARQTSQTTTSAPCHLQSVIPPHARIPTPSQCPKLARPAIHQARPVPERCPRLPRGPHSATLSPHRPLSRLPTPTTPHLKMTQTTSSSRMTTNSPLLLSRLSIHCDTPKCRVRQTKWYLGVPPQEVHGEAGRKADSMFVRFLSLQAC